MISKIHKGPKSNLKKDKLLPFGGNYLTRLDAVNYKLMCNLSVVGSDSITDCKT